MYSARINNFSFLSTPVRHISAPVRFSPVQSGGVMKSLAEEIQSFSRTRLRKQRTRVTSLSGRRVIETWKGSTITVVEDPAPPESMMGYVPDTSWDLRVGVVKPDLLLGEFIY